MAHVLYFQYWACTCLRTRWDAIEVHFN